MGMTVKEYFIEEVISEPRIENHEIESHDILWPTGSRREAAKIQELPSKCLWMLVERCQQKLTGLDEPVPCEPLHRWK